MYLKFNAGGEGPSIVTDGIIEHPGLVAVPGTSIEGVAPPALTEVPTDFALHLLLSTLERRWAQHAVPYGIAPKLRPSLTGRRCAINVRASGDAATDTGALFVSKTALPDGTKTFIEIRGIPLTAGFPVVPGQVPPRPST
jgi:hypothetical protein